MPKKYPTIKYLRQCMRYKSGRVFWLKRPRSHFDSNRSWNVWNARYAFKEAGGRLKMDSGDRWSISINHEHFQRSRIVWALVYGEWSKARVIDHKNRNPIDDAPENLREATWSQNQGNARKPRHNTSGFKGVTKTISGKWQVMICKKYIGIFSSPQDAHEAYLKAAKYYYGAFAFDG